MPEVGVEPTRSYDHWFLRPARMPFRHSGKINFRVRIYL